MTLWILEPRDPIIFRDGRPFGTTPGAQAASLIFPFPSTIAGGIRTRAGLNEQGTFIWTKGSSEIKKLRELPVRGPVLVEIVEDDQNTTIHNWLLPTPTDALIFEPKEGEKYYTINQLVPLALPANVQVSAMHQTRPKQGEDKPSSSDLTLVGLPTPDQRKPAKGTPLYWSWAIFRGWLHAPHTLTKIQDLSELGHSGPQREHRTHVSINPETLTAQEGMLFGTSGLDFTYTTGHQDKRLSSARRMALAIETEDIPPFRMHEGIAALGGERRMVTWRKSTEQLPACPPEIVEAIIKAKHCRIILLTPAYFEQGYYPTWLQEPHNGVTSTLKAIAISRPQTVSGWDFEYGHPKPTRRLAPAGTVLFLSIEGDDADIKNWVEQTWMQCVSDHEQDRRDGFGLAVLGTWSGVPQPIKIGA